MVRATYAYKYVLPHLTYTSTYFFNWSLPRAPTRTYFFNPVARSLYEAIPSIATQFHVSHFFFALVSSTVPWTYKCTPWALTWYDDSRLKHAAATHPPIPSQAARDYCVVHRFPIKGYHAKTCRSQSMVSATTTRALVVVEKPGRDRATHGDHLGHPVGFQGQALVC